MISEIVLFRLPDGMSRADAMTKYRARVSMWQANPDLIHKAFLFDETSRRGGGVYLWKNIEAAKKAHGPAFEEAIQSILALGLSSSISRHQSLSTTPPRKWSITLHKVVRLP